MLDFDLKGDVFLQMVMSCRDRVLIGGMTNENWLVTLPDATKVVLRIPGEASKEFVCRQNEKNNNCFMREVGVAPALLYFNENSGIKITPYIEGAETLTPLSVCKHFQAVADILTETHSSRKLFLNRFLYEDQYVLYRSLMRRCKLVEGEYVCLFDDAVQFLLNELRKIGVEWRNCHCDPVPENFIISHGCGLKDKLYLIDWEYSGLNDPYWDVAAFCEESDLNYELENEFIKIYHEGKFGSLDSARQKVLIFKILQNILWHCWTLVKEAYGEDFGAYAEKRKEAAIRQLSLYDADFR